ncbi:MAG: hypothetical protein HWE26_13830 [Alteromonadaceae bacterium]|nr:hypothetical protein [Alteromonadaceae bacterium]
MARDYSNLPRVIRKSVKGRAYYYYRATKTEAGQTREKYIRIDADPASPDFLAAVRMIENGTHAATAPRSARYTWQMLCDQFKVSSDFLRNSIKHRSNQDKWMTRILDANGSKDVRKLTRAEVKRAHQRATEKYGTRAADHYLQTTSKLLSFAIQELEWPIASNVATGIKKNGTQSAYEPWPAEMIDALDDAPAEVAIACRLILLTGQRPTAGIVMRFDAFDRSRELMTLHNMKGDRIFDVYCPPETFAYIDSLPRTGAHILPQTATTPRGYHPIEKAFREWRATLDPRFAKFSLHGLRKSAIQGMAEAGYSDAEIQSVTDQSAQTVAMYRKRASRIRLSKNAAQRASREAARRSTDN